jgi:hypothetical protein
MSDDDATTPKPEKPAAPPKDTAAPSDPPGGKPQPGSDATPAPTTQEDAVRGLLNDAPDLAPGRAGQIIEETLTRLTEGLINLNVFKGEFHVDGDFLAGATTNQGGRQKRSSRRATKLRLDPKVLAEESNLYVPPVGFAQGLDALDDHCLAIFAGPARTGRRSRAITSLVKVMERNELPVEIFELTGDVLGNMTWRVPQTRCGFVVIDRSSGKPAASAVDDRWLTFAADRLRENGSYLVVTTGPVQGALATAPKRAEFVLEDMELPDPVEIVRRHVADRCPWVSDHEWDKLLLDTELADILYDRDDPTFATRVANTVTEALRDEADLTEVVAKLRDPEQEVREWLSAGPDTSEIAFVLAAAALEGSSYLNVADAAVALYREIGSGSASLTPRYLRRLTMERSWIESTTAPDDPDGPPVVRFRHADLRAVVLTLTWFELDGAREKIFKWLTTLAEHSDVEVRVRAAGSAGVLATSDFDHGLHKYFLPWGRSRSTTLRQSAALGLNVAGRIGDRADTVWSQIEQWAELVRYDDNARYLPTTAALAAGGPLGTADPRRALRLLRTLLCDGAWDFLEPAALSTHMLLAAGRVDEVLDALQDWTGSTAATDTNFVIKALIIFAFAAKESGSAETGRSKPVLLAAAEPRRGLVSELWGRALSNKPVRPLAIEALRVWVRTVDADPSTQDDVVDVFADIADLGGDHAARVRHVLRQWAEDVDDPSDAATDIYNELFDAGE